MAKKGGCCKRPGARRQIGRKSKGETKNKDQQAAKQLNALRLEATARLRSADTPGRAEQPAHEPQETDEKPRKRTRFEMPQDEQRRRLAIQEVYINMGMPESSTWSGKNGTVARIAKSLCLSKDSHRSITDTLNRILEENETFDGKRRTLQYCIPSDTTRTRRIV